MSYVRVNFDSLQNPNKIPFNKYVTVEAEGGGQRNLRQIVTKI